jgi:predicted nucleotidyltransferase
MLTKELISDLSDWGLSHPEVAAIYIFGSRAKGNNRKDSDIDIAVELDESYSYIKEDFSTYWSSISSQFKAELSAILPYKVDFQGYHIEFFPVVFSYVASNSIVVYEKYAKQF